MSFVLPPLAVGFAAFCVWLAVRIVNRQERWAKWMLAAAPMLVVFLYPIAYLLLMDPLWTIPYFGAGQWERYPVYPSWFLDQEDAETCFRFAHEIDRRLRPDFWSERRPYLGGRQP